MQNPEEIEPMLSSSRLLEGWLILQIHKYMYGNAARERIVGIGFAFRAKG